MHKNTRRSIFLFIASLFGVTQAQPILAVNFDQIPQGALSLAQVKTDWPGVTWANGLTEGRVSVLGTPDPHQAQFIRITYPQGAFGPSQGGAQWRSNFGGKADTMFTSYWVRPSADFDFVKGGKLPGLCGSQCNTGGEIPTGSDGWSARMMWRTGGAVVLYLYYPDQTGTYAVDFPLMINNAEVKFTPGTWSKIKTQVILNTPGTKNGIVRCWFNGTLALEQKGLRLRDQDTMHVDQFYFSTFHGGNDATWAPSRTVTMDFDDFIISTIDPDGASSIPYSKTIKQSLLRPILNGNHLWIPKASQDWMIRILDQQGKTLFEAKKLGNTPTIELPSLHTQTQIVITGNEQSWVIPYTR